MERFAEVRRENQRERARRALLGTTIWIGDEILGAFA
jgi:hypothetical protein